jgi:hypothetical protein
MYLSSIGQPTSMKCLCCVYYRTQCISVVKFQAESSRCPSFSSVRAIFLTRYNAFASLNGRAV